MQNVVDTHQDGDERNFVDIYLNEMHKRQQDPTIAEKDGISFSSKLNIVKQIQKIYSIIENI